MEVRIKSFSELTCLELHDIYKLRAEVFVVEQECVYNDIDGNDLNSTHIFFLEEGRVIACERVVDAGFSYEEASIGRVAVDREFRGKGLARRLLEEAIDCIRNDLQKSDVRISAQKYLEKFYESFGFTVCSEEYLEDGIPHIEMYLKL